jgi:outer membrane protein assembly factor BamB
MRFLALLALALLGVSLFAADLDPLDNWMRWRGPLATGEAPRGKPPLKWDEKTNIAWKTVLPGKGSSTPIILGDLVFVTTAEDTGRKADDKNLPKSDPRFKKIPKVPGTFHRFIVLALDRKTGTVRWRRTAAEVVPHEGHHDTHSYAAGSPTTEGKRLYVSFGSFGVYCYDLKGTLLWQKNLGRMETRLGWGEGTSPAVHDGKLFHTWDHEGASSLVALEAASGKVLWRVPRDEVTSWATPLPVIWKGKTQVIVMGTKKIRGYDAENGKVIWECGGMTVNCIPSPVARDGVVYCMSGYKGAAAVAVSLDAKGDVPDKVLWKLDHGTPYVPSPLLAGERLYFTLRNEPILTSVDAASGKVIINQARLNALRNLYASPVAAAGRIYLSDRAGTTMVIKQSDKLEVLAINKLGETLDASPAVAGKQLFLRGEKHLFCVEEKGK